MKKTKENMDLRQLRAFDAVVRHGGFSKASQEIGLTQPTLSTHILNLENELGIKLFDRSGRTVTLTPAGKVLKEYSLRILDLCRESIQAVEAFSGQIRGEVHIESSTVPGEYILPRWLKNFHRAYPEVQVTLTVDDSKKVIDEVVSGNVPFGVTGIQANHPSLESEMLCEDEIILVASRDLAPHAAVKPINVRDIGRFPLIRREAGSGTRTAIEKALRKHRLLPDRLNWTIALGSTRAVIEGALSGLGAAFLSKCTVTKEVSEGQLVVINLQDFTIRRGFYVVSSRNKTLSPAAEKLREELLNAGPGLLQ